jgi:multidrug efflux pump subunit AcrB
VLLSSAAVFSGPWLTGIELDVSALMGLTKVIGMVTELIVFYLSELDQAAAVDAESQRKAGAKRLRPILMSALIAILTLSPLAMAINFWADRSRAIGSPGSARSDFGGFRTVRTYSSSMVQSLRQ